MKYSEEYFCQLIKNTDLSRGIYRNDAKHISVSSCGRIFPSDDYVIKG